MPTLSPIICVAQLMITGMVKRVIKLLSAVRVTDRATSPPASLENTFDELPPGQQAISISPIKNTGVRLKAQANPSAISGSKYVCTASAELDGTIYQDTIELDLPTEFTPRVEPTIDGNGAYILGNVAYYEIGGRYYAVNEDGGFGRLRGRMDRVRSVIVSLHASIFAAAGRIPVDCGRVRGAVYLNAEGRET